MKDASFCQFVLCILTLQRCFESAYTIGRKMWLFLEVEGIYVDTSVWHINENVLTSPHAEIGIDAYAACSPPQFRKQFSSLEICHSRCLPRDATECVNDAVECFSVYGNLTYIQPTTDVVPYVVCPLGGVNVNGNFKRCCQCFMHIKDCVNP